MVPSLQSWDGCIRCLMMHMINLDLYAKALCYKLYLPSLLTLWKPLNVWAPEVEITSSRGYTRGKKKKKKSNLILVTHISTWFWLQPFSSFQDNKGSNPISYTLFRGVAGLFFLWLTFYISSSKLESGPVYVKFQVSVSSYFIWS